MKITKTICLLLFLVITCSIVNAANVPEMRFKSIRQMGMGGVGVATARDHTALYTNPAALSRLNEMKITLPRFRMGPSTEFIDSIPSFQEIQNSSDEGEQLDLLTAMVPKNMIADISLDPIVALAAKDFGIGLYSSSLVKAGLLDSLDPVLELNSYSDIAPIIGYSKELGVGEHKFAVGISGKFINRVRLYDKQTGAETFTLDQAEIMEGVNNNDLIDKVSNGTNAVIMSGIGIDLGVLTNITTALGKGEIGFALHNIGASVTGQKDLFDSSGNKTSDENVTKEIPVTGVIGIGIDTSLPAAMGELAKSVGSFTIAIDYKLISPDDSWAKNLFMGIEKSFNDGVINLRGGLNQGYVVGGIGLDFGFLNLEYAYFAEELGAEIGVMPGKYHVFQLGFFL
jgi:hypothetical protein